MATEDFIDYYELMQISPNAEVETVQRVFRMLATRYHPDNAKTGDNEKFVLLNRAYKVLSDADSRAAYDVECHLRHGEPLPVFELKEFAAGIDGEANRRMGILCLLYSRRRTDIDDPGISILELEKIMSFPREHLIFTLWYLKEKTYLQQAEDSDFWITAEGVDYVEKHLPANRILYKLLKAAENGTARAGGEEDWISEESESKRKTGGAR